MTPDRVRHAFGSVDRRLDKLQHLPDISPRLFAALTILPVLVTYIVVAVATIPLPDIVAARLATQPPSTVVTDDVVLTLSIQNRGGSPVPGAVARYYLKPLSSGGGTDKFVGQKRLGILSPGDVTTVSKTIVLPNSVAPGTYTVRACVAPTVPTAEKNIRNNCQQSAPFQIASNQAH